MLSAEEKQSVNQLIEEIAKEEEKVKQLAMHELQEDFAVLAYQLQSYTPLLILYIQLMVTLFQSSDPYKAFERGKEDFKSGQAFNLGMLQYFNDIALAPQNDRLVNAVSGFYNILDSLLIARLPLGAIRDDLSYIVGLGERHCFNFYKLGYMTSKKKHTESE